uniref:Replicative DNA helicase n=1 Tax=Synarthrophyton chejuense TaxID=2485825 RepID=A0A3G3MFU7_9FLOR|nr:replication helicase subunit [Synarthrophyton chejuense]AYR05692.1 replication helicase subunit [Synarthrophyton chejuense]
MVKKIKYKINCKTLPPQNIVAEEILLGNLLVNKSIADTIIGNVKSDFFSLEKHQILYLNIINIYNQYDYISTTHLIYLLWHNKVLSKIGGIEQITYLIQKSQILLSYTEDKYNTQEYIKVIYKNYIRRAFIQYGQNILQLSYINNITIQELYNKSSQYLQEINKIIDYKQNDQLQNLISDFLLKFNKSITKEINQNTESGFQGLDNITKGFQDGDLIVIAGRPSMGKTSFAINITKNIILNLNLGVYIFSLEMSKNQILDKIISSISNIKVNNIQKKILKEYEWPKLHKACKLLMQTQLYIDDKGQSSIKYIISKVKLVNSTNKKKTIIIIDYLQLIQSNKLKIDNRTQELGYITRELKLLAKSLNIPIIILSQLNRSIENRINKRPLLSDLRESGCISYENLPNKNLQKIETLHNFKSFYKTYISFFHHLKKSSKQYTYFLASNNNNIKVTHNHKILTEERWKKEDQIKKHNNNSSYRNYYIRKNLKSYIELNILLIIKLLNNNKVYDIEMNEYCNFLTNKQIIHNSIEQDADLVLMLYQEEKSIKDKIIDIIISKHRNGPVGSFQLLFHKNMCKFHDLQNRKPFHNIEI